MRELARWIMLMVMPAAAFLVTGCRKVHEEQPGKFQHSEFLIVSYFADPRFSLSATSIGGERILLQCDKRRGEISLASDSAAYRKLAAKYGDGGFDLYFYRPGGWAYAEPLAVECAGFAGLNGSDSVWRDVGDSVELVYGSYVPVLGLLRSGNPPLEYRYERPSVESAQRLGSLGAGDLTLVDCQRELAIRAVAPYRLKGRYRVKIRAGKGEWQTLKSHEWGRE